jgi:hypothetical protein
MPIILHYITKNWTYQDAEKCRFMQGISVGMWNPNRFRTSNWYACYGNFDQNSCDGCTFYYDCQEVKNLNLNGKIIIREEK